MYNKKIEKSKLYTGQKKFMKIIYFYTLHHIVVRVLCLCTCGCNIEKEAR